METFENNLYEHPIIAFGISICSIFLGFLFKIFAVLNTWHIPPIIIELAQLTSYGFGITIGCITVYSFIKKSNGKSR